MLGSRLRPGQQEERRDAEPSREQRSVPAPALTPQNIVALQPSAGNAALARFVQAHRPTLARTKPEHVELLKRCRANLQILEDTVKALLDNRKKFDAMYDGYQYVQAEVTKLEEHITNARPLLDDVEAEKDPGAALKAAIAVIKLGGAEKERLEKAYGEEEVRGARKKLESERAERELKEQKAAEQTAYLEKKQKDEEQKQQQAAAAEQQRQQEMSTLGVTPNSSGPAYDYSNNGARRQAVLRYIQLRHPAFSNLSATETNQHVCFIYHLTLAQIQRVEGFLEGRKVTEFKWQNIPNTRTDTGLQSPMVMPNRVAGVTPELGGEIFCDWAVERARHSSSIARIAESFTFTARADFVTGGWGTITGQNNKAYRYNASGKRLVTNANRTAIITYYDGD